MFQVLKWGVVGAGKISNDFVCAVHQSNPTEHQFVAVASKSSDTARNFAKRLNIATSYGSYQELANDDNVQVVYIGNLNVEHYETAKLFLEHGKHILMEKPLTMNAKQTESILKFAKSKNLLLMEALWSRFLPSYQFVLKQIQNGAIGDIIQVRAEFGVQIANVERINQKSLGGGTVLDLGVYCINLLQMSFGNEFPEEIVAVGHLNDQGIDLNVSAALKYSNGRTGVIVTHSAVQLPNEAEIVGTKGVIKLLPFFHCCEDVSLNGQLHRFPLPNTTPEYNFRCSTGLVFEANEIRRLLLDGKIESNVMPHQDSITIARIQDEIRNKLSVRFEADNI